MRSNGRVSFEATYFHMTENGVVLSQRQGPFFFPTNAGELRYNGVETGAERGHHAEGVGVT